MINKKAWEDDSFMNRDELRSVRLHLEMLRPRIVLDEKNIKSTTAIFGSARITDEHEQMGKWYNKTAKFAKLMTEYGREVGEGEFVVTTGGGPGLMEAGNKGAYDAGGESIGLSINLPFEQHSNKYVSKDMDFLFNYFAVRKIHFLLRAKAVAIVPGGFGTMDEFFELITLIQTGRMEKIPIVLFGKEFWNKTINFEYLAKMGVISKEDLDLFVITDSPKKGVKYIKEFYS